MSDSPSLVGVHRVTRVRTLGDAVPTFRPFRDDSQDVKVVPRSSDEIRAEMDERRDNAPMSTSCAIDGCPFTFEGTAGECRTAASQHRAAAHPGLKQRHRKGAYRFKRRGEQVDPATVAESRRLRQEKDDAGRLAMIEAGRAARGEPLLEEAAAERLGPDGAASSNGPPLSLVEADPGPEEPAATPHGASTAAPAAAPTGKQPSGKASASTTDKETPMENRYGLKRAGRGFAWTRDAAIQAVKDFHATLGRSPQQQDSRDEPTGTLPSETAAAKLFHGWDDMIRAAGLEPAEKLTFRHEPGRASPHAKPAAAPATVEVLQAAGGGEERLPAVRDPIRTAEIPYDADLLESEAVFLRQRAAALEQIAAGIRTLADLSQERAA